MGQYSVELLFDEVAECIDREDRRLQALVAQARKRGTSIKFGFQATACQLQLEHLQMKFPAIIANAISHVMACSVTRSISVRKGPTSHAYNVVP